MFSCIKLLQNRSEFTLKMLAGLLATILKLASDLAEKGMEWKVSVTNDWEVDQIQ